MRISRRHLLQGMALAAAVPHLRAASLAGERVGAQVYVFTQHYRREGTTLAAQVPAMLRAHQEAGFRHVELMADLLQGPALEALRRAHAEGAMRFPVVYSGARLFEASRVDAEVARVAGIARVARSLGVRYLNCNPDPKPQKAAKSDGELATEAAGINRLAAAVRDEGLTLLLHQHDPEMQEEARNWRYWVKNTDLATVRFCFDTHWALRGGQDPLTLLRECRPRVECLHLRNSRQGVWWECLDDGDLDYRAVAAFLRKTNYEGLLMVELAWDPATRITRSLEENLRRSRTYVERRFL